MFWSWLLESVLVPLPFAAKLPLTDQPKPTALSFLGITALSSEKRCFYVLGVNLYSGYYDKRKGFYKVYGDLFEKIYQHELNLARKLGFATVNDFCQEDEYKLTLASDRNSRRMMEDVNKKLRKKAKRDYNVTVRGLAEFVKRRDKRVIEMQIKRNEELEKKNEAGRKRMEELEREKADRVRNYVEPEWLRVEELQDGEIEEEQEEKGEEKELYCVVCGKKFKSEKQWINHEQSKKHKENEKMAALR
ncbi:dnaJ homolog subfamily C member 21-like [Solanum tuberosum]|uniref:dnaJ homolog subfamily C member 21-like n=1 Tax=Solanum tuberosum TaxID=4113 RepID=UPI00073A390C|nr:PREDICTED: dnaJ homolog subfamily C member 21-like [Solanum tuberosum]